jgi:hypothetical protein
MHVPSFYPFKIDMIFKITIESKFSNDLFQIQWSQVLLFI